MRFLTIATLTIFLSVACLFSLQTVLLSMAHSENGIAHLTIVEDQRNRMTKRMCMAKWPVRGRLYDECLEGT